MNSMHIYKLHPNKDILKTSILNNELHLAFAIKKRFGVSCLTKTKHDFRLVMHQMQSTEKHSNMLQPERKHVITHKSRTADLAKSRNTVKTFSIKLIKSDCISRQRER